jgi:cytochrome c5
VKPAIRSIRVGVVALTASVLLWAVVVFGQSQQPAKHSGKSAKVDPVTSIELPQFAPDIPDGPHVTAYRSYCLTCHSTRYVATQPRFSQAVWEKEVKKMIDAYGAVIPEAQQHEIVEYLVAVKGTSAGK